MYYSGYIAATVLVIVLGARIASKFAIICNEEERENAYEEEDYYKIIGLNEKLDEKRKRFFSYKYEMLYLYFATYDYKNYWKIRSTVKPIQLKCDKFYQDNILYMDMMLLYLNQEAELANEHFEKHKTRIEKYLSKEKKYQKKNFFRMVLIAKLFYENKFDATLEIYDKDENIATRKYSWAILNYYRCKIHELNNEYEKICYLVRQADEKLSGNGYNALFDCWRK